mgnify:CR=1 FL=1
MITLEKIKSDKINQYLINTDAQQINKSGEPVFAITGNLVFQEKDSPLLNVEISLRKCERVGLFKHYGKKPNNASRRCREYDRIKR